MTKTAVIYSPIYLKHDPGPTHPESPKRLEIMINELKKSRFLEKEDCKLLEPREANETELQLVHKADYIELVKKICLKGGGTLDLGDTVASAESFKVAKYAAGGALKAVEQVLEGKFKNAFTLVRPPGHHAGSYYPCGFCIFNNIAIAAQHLIQNLGLEKVLILDIDAHHGNGTQEIFYNTNKVFYISLHQDPRGFPGTGFPDEIGEGKGLGFTLNIPFPFRTSDEIYLEAFNSIVVPVIEQYAPQFILVSTGFDCHYTDPVASLCLSANAYSVIFEKIVKLADKYCGGKLVAVLEGGYSFSFIGKLAALAVSKMAGFEYLIDDQVPERYVGNERVKKNAEKILKEVKNYHSSFWNLD